MPAKDKIHDIVKKALIKDGWEITHDPYTVEYETDRVYADLGAERVIAAIRGHRMDKLAQYSQLIKKHLEQHAELANCNPSPTRETHLILDDQRQHYMLFDTGWWEKTRIHTPVLYVRLHHDKIWIEEDWTESGLATELVAAGVPKTDIVLAFHHPSVRPLTDFAAA